MADLDSMKAAQLNDARLSGMITALTSSQPVPSDVAPGLKHVFLQEGVLCRMYQASSSAAEHPQIVIPDSLKHTVLDQLHNHLECRKP